MGGGQLGTTASSPQEEMSLSRLQRRHRPIQGSENTHNFQEQRTRQMGTGTGEVQEAAAPNCYGVYLYIEASKWHF